MNAPIPWYLPAILGVLFGILVWAIACVVEKRRRGGKDR